MANHASFTANKSVSIQAPATVANLVCGFDVLGLCLNNPFDIMEVSMIEERTVICETTDGFQLPTDPAQNTAGAPVLEMMEKLDLDFGFRIVITKKIKPGSGLGSSAASAAGAAFAANYLLGQPFSKTEMVSFAMAGEKVATGVKHADNVAPAIFGGVTLIKTAFPLEVVSLAAPMLYVSIVHPQIEVKTADARQILRKEVLLKDAIKQWGNIAGLVAGFLQNNYALIGSSLKDHIIEPVRSILIPAFDEVKETSMQLGALGGGISGSGPSLFMLSTTRQTAETIAESMGNIYDTCGIQSFTYVSQINYDGVKVIKQNF